MHVMYNEYVLYVLVLNQMCIVYTAQTIVTLRCMVTILVAIFNNYTQIKPCY